MLLIMLEPPWAGIVKPLANVNPLVWLGKVRLARELLEVIDPSVAFSLPLPFFGAVVSLVLGALFLLLVAC
jgi:hypothetical protein